MPNTSSLQRAWGAEDAAALQAMAEQFPREIGESPVLEFIVQSEGIR